MNAKFCYIIGQCLENVRKFVPQPKDLKFQGRWLNYRCEHEKLVSSGIISES